MGERSEISRRRLLALAAAMGATLAAGCAHRRGSAAIERRDLFPQGVASGDPDETSVILWTRRPPSAGETHRTIAVEVARDRAFEHVVVAGQTSISADTDWTCRFLAAGLTADQEYFYRFIDEDGHASRIGRTITAPERNDPRVRRFAFVSCQDPTEGALNAYRRMIFEDEQKPRAEQLSFVLHLGDFIYEVVWYPEDRAPGARGRRLRDLVRYPNGEKIRDFHVPTTLEDYRTAYRAYLTDPELQDARARWPFVCVWDNHEFSWAGYQSQQVFGGETRPAQTKKVAANQAWFEFQPARVAQPGGEGLDRFDAPEVEDAPIGAVDEAGLGLELNNLAAVNSLIVRRVIRWGANFELFITDNHSFRSAPPDYELVAPEHYRWMYQQEGFEILDNGRAHGGANPPARIAMGAASIENPSRNAPAQSFLGLDQKDWIKRKLAQSRTPWKIWGHSFGTLDWRTDIRNLPAGVAPPWPGEGYALFNGGFCLEKAELFDFIKDEGITGFAIVAGDKHSFWAGYPSKALPPLPFEPVGVEFITGAISSAGLFEIAEQRIAADDSLRPLFLHDAADGEVQPAMNMTMLHGVRAAWALHETGDEAAARALSNPDVAPHVKFADLAGNGYSVVDVSSDVLEVEFVAIERPLERSNRPDGGPLVYRVRHRAALWRRGERPVLDQSIIEGVPRLAT